MFQLPVDHPFPTCRNRMVQAVRALAIVGMFSGAFVGQAFADGGDVRAEGTVTVYTRTGGIIEKKITDEKVLNDLLKDATVIPDAALMMHNGHWYLLKDHKMASGTMSFDMLGTGH